MEDNVLCYSAELNKYQSVNKRIVTPEWSLRTGYKAVEIPQEKPLLCDEIKANGVIEAPKNKGGRPKKEKLIN